MPTKAFITHFREKIFYIGVQNVHIPKIYFARVFHQAYISFISKERHAMSTLPSL